MQSSNNSDQVWQLRHEDIILPEDEVHVWRASLDQPPLRVEGFLGALAPDEKERARRFYFRKDHDHFVVARGLLRTILAR